MPAGRASRGCEPGRPRKGLSLALAACGAALVCGCAGGQRAVVDDPARAYPGGLPVSAAADVHVLRNDTRISFTNATGGTLGPGTLWLNKEFFAPFEAMPAGQTRTLRLGGFTNRYGQSYRAGGFFATQPPALLVAVELEPEGGAELVPLLVVRGEGR